MYKNSNTARKIDETKIIKIKKNNRHSKNKLISFVFTFCVFLITLSCIFIFLFNRAKSNEFAYKNFENHVRNSKYSENFNSKDTKNFECVSCATEDKIVVL